VGEADLLKKLRAGDKAAFNELVSAYSKKVINTCYRFLLNSQDAEDISQEVFVEVFQSIRSFQGNSKLSTWIYRIAITKSLDEIKKQNRKKRIGSVGKLLHLDGVANWLAGGVLPDESLHQNERMAAVMQALNTLPDNQRVAFTLSKIEGYTNAEIVEIMNTTSLAVESLLSRAKTKVGDQLKVILKNK
jgi:RNA polymerase sigma-70 factor, ECF subfamily